MKLVRLLLPVVALVVAACTSAGGYVSPVAEESQSNPTPTLEPAGPQGPGLPGPATNPTPNSSAAGDQVSANTELPGNLLSVSPAPGPVFGLNLNVCAVFEETGDAAERWDGPVWIQIGDAEHRPFISVTTESADGTIARNMCVTVREMLETDEMESPPPDGPLDVGVRFFDPDGIEQSHTWTVDFQVVSTPHAPEDVKRVREIYRLLQAIDANADSGDERISGYFLKGDLLEIYLFDHANADAVRAEVEALLGDKMPSGGIQFSRLDPIPEGQSVYQWIDEVSRAVHGLSDIPLHGMSGGCCNVWDRVHVMVGTNHAAHRIRQALEEADVPQEAVFIRVSTVPTLHEPSAGAHNVGTTLEFEPVTRLGEALRVDIVWTNLGDEPVEFTYSPVVPVTLHAFTHGGERVWSSHLGGVIAAIGATAELAPGEEKRFTHYWNLVDVDGFLVEPGDYVLQAQENAGSDRAMVSEAYPLTIE